MSLNQSHFKHYPVGQPVPDSVHAVCCSLPTMRDVIGYEEKHAETMEAVQIGYPRFVLHKYVRQAVDCACAELGLAGQVAFGVVSLRAAQELDAFVQAQSCSITPVSDWVLVTFPFEEASAKKAKSFLQHTGLSISSRQAEDYLVALGELESPQAEACFQGDSETFVLEALRQYIRSPHIGITNSGMNAFYAAFKAVHEIQQAAGKAVYLQIGWLYLDTQEILNEFLGEDETVITHLDVHDKAGIEAIFEKFGDQIAAVISEFPTNPLMQTLDIEHLNALAVKHRAIRIYDPTMSSIANVNLLPHTDVLTTSLTKYAAHQGDVMIGAYALNEDSPYYDELKIALPAEVEAPYARNLARLAWEIQEMPNVVASMNANAVRVVEYLKQHPAVKKVHWSQEAASAENYSKIAVGEAKPGAVITIELNKSLADFYNPTPIVKGPSFGTYFTMMCPFLYLAHYDLVSNIEGREKLLSLGLEPDLVRISIGVEPFEEIVAALEQGFNA